MALEDEALEGRGLESDEEKALEALAEALAEASDDDFPAHDAARAALDTARGYAAWVWRDEEATRDLRAHTERSGRYWGSIPELADDVHDLAGLGRIADFIFVS